MDNVDCIIFILKVIILTLNLLVSIILYLTCREARQVKEKMESQPSETEGDEENSLPGDEELLNNEEPDTSKFGKQSFSCPELHSIEP